MNTTTDRQRRHDEQWQHAVLDGLARMLDVLHDISDGLQQLNAATPPSTPQTNDPTPHGPQLMSVNDLAEHLGVAPSLIRSRRYIGDGPPATMVGSRVFYNRSDVDAWLAQR